MKQFLSVLAVALVGLSPASALAQQGTAEIRGQVMDQQGGVLPGVAVVARDQESGRFRETVTSADGTYFFSGLRPGVYEISAELEEMNESPFNSDDLVDPKVVDPDWVDPLLLDPDPIDKAEGQ